MYLVRLLTLFVIWISYPAASHGQCLVQSGPPPSSLNFSTAGVGAGVEHSRWFIALDSINGDYKPAVGMNTLGPNYHNNGKDWLSFSSTGEHSGNRFFFYKKTFDLPCKNLCAKSYAEPNAYCLQLDLYADNSIYEVYVNGVAQSDNLGKIIPLPSPFNPVGHTQKDKIPVKLCRDWKEGSNTLIIKVASSATVLGLMVEPAANALPTADDSVSAIICEGDKYNFYGKLLDTSGKYYQTLTNVNGCDTTILLNLRVMPMARSLITKFICKGESYLGYTQEGIYQDIFTGLSGCDSIRTLHLRLTGELRPDFKQPVALCEGDSAILYPGTFDSYQWQDGSTDSQFVVTKPGLYSVRVTSACGTDVVQVDVKKGACDVAFPNAFTPNLDGHNDFFRIATNLPLAKFQLNIYNRWGQVIFQSNDAGRGWDGRLNGQLQSAGTYAWKCTYEYQSISHHRSGTLLLIR